MSGGGTPSNESQSQTLRVVSPYAARTARIRMDAPPRQTPHSTRSPGTSSASTVSTHCCRLVSRCIPIIVSASAGQSSPKSRLCASNARLRTST
ncbi:Uncharacterised protein [Mycobacteroides abscessus subsp. abscessus]|nr:Uncharacterised protein [Mycobacteroides abscessus subsp. abscessus]